MEAGLRLKFTQPSIQHIPTCGTRHLFLMRLEELVPLENKSQERRLQGLAVDYDHARSERHKHLHRILRGYSYGLGTYNQDTIPREVRQWVTTHYNPSYLSAQDMVTGYSPLYAPIGKSLRSLGLSGLVVLSSVC